ncbi:hypothetical protein ACIBI9_21560 [Nonomuraea sp. NPDC050451]|uniref:hypothetical protein n=1 Tax=Nonomuraea sp. NPDC050451 TaxID=3364364 RepID=UPI0037A57C41
MMFGGAVLTLIAALFPLIDQPALADHLRAGYPAYGPEEIGGAVTAYTVIVAVVGAIGLLGWFATVWAVRVGKGWARWLASGLLAIAAVIAVAGLTVQDVNGQVGLAPLVGWIQVLPCVAGLAAVVPLWRRA